MDKQKLEFYEEEIEIPFKVIRTTTNITEEKEYWCLTPSKDYDFFGCGIVVQGDSYQDAVDQFWNTVASCCEFHKDKSDMYYKTCPLIIGPWSRTGGRWIKSFGVGIYFRYGKGMKGGFYVPFTKLNISFSNAWKYKKK